MKNKVIRNTFLVVFTITTSILITSCQKRLGTYIPVYYNISNVTDNKLTVYYNYVPHNGGQEYDTVIRIEPGHTKTLLVQLNSYQNLGNPEIEDTLTRISLIQVYTIDSIESKTNFRLTKNWIYTEYATKSDLHLNIKPEDFY